MENYIRFDWAMKRLLRNKANFSVLEGFLTTLLGEKIKIRNLLESESNQEDEFDKYNRVDMLAEDEKGQLLLIEVQNNNEYAYFQRMLFGTSKLVTEYINKGDPYGKIRKVYSINIVYFALGHGTDYVYHGKTEFRGIHTNEVLQLSPFQQQRFEVEEVSQLYPEYYILKVNDFNKVAKTPLEEWIYYLHTGEIPSTMHAPGLDEARERLRINQMSKAERMAYDRHIDNLVILKDNVYTAREEGEFEGRKKGMAEGLQKGLEQGKKEGLEQGKKEGLEQGIQKGMAEGMQKGMEQGKQEAMKSVAKQLKITGMQVEQIAAVTGLSLSEIENL